MASKTAKSKDSKPTPITDGASSDALSLLGPILEDLKDNITCKICCRLLYEPFTNSCGHTFCYSCLCQWFAEAGGHRTQSCPDCRAKVQHAPAPNYAVRNMVSKFIQHIHLTGDENSYEEHLAYQQQEKEIVEADRNSKDERIGGLFKGKFKHRTLEGRLQPTRVIHDIDDGVDRCPGCNWEVEEIEDGRCTNCGHPIDDSSDSENDEDFDPDDSAHVAATFSDFDEDEDLDGEIDMEDAEYDDVDDSSDDQDHLPQEISSALRDGNTIDLTQSSDPESPDFESSFYMGNQIDSLTDGAEESEDDGEGDSFTAADEDPMEEDEDMSSEHDDNEDEENDSDHEESSDSTPRQLIPQSSRGGRNTMRGPSRRVIDSDDDNEDTSPATTPATGGNEQGTTESSGESSSNDDDIDVNQPIRRWAGFRS
ncbi:MAG: hypothetical protein M1831_006746 [Alyxoria varia]|nr:MAG: hypothetical protein M1831_006746 [Alyxoria varia]